MKLRLTWHTIALIAMLIAMWYAAEAQSNGAAYILGLLAGLIALLSILHARANLRGLSLTVRTANAAREGLRSRARVEVRNASARAASGLEVQIIGAEQSHFIEQLPSMQSQIVELPIPPQHPHLAPLRLLVRSAYPLGLFHMEQVVETAAVRRVHPRPVGTLPLPEARPLSAQSPATSSGRGLLRASRGGDDFAGTREFQPGDSPRHIDWRAVARGRPLAVKTWASSSTGVIVLDWSQVPLPEKARAGQIARWIEQCEREEKPYTLLLPGQEPIEAGIGENHSRRCLDALADFSALSVLEDEKDGKAQKASQGRANSIYENTAHLSAGPLFTLSIALAAAIAPLAPYIAWPCVAVAALCMVYRVLFRREVPSLMMRLVALLGGVLMTILLYSGQRSMEAGIALLTTLCGVKLLESRTPREFQILALIGWFFCLCTLILDNSLPRTLWCLAVFLLICTCMVRFRGSTLGLGQPLRFTTLLFAQALPLVIALFALLPRGVLNLESLLNSKLGQSGISNELDPGGITQMVMRLDKAFRVEFPSGTVPTNDLRYWRCIVLHESHGFSWRRGRDPGTKLISAAQRSGGELEQIIHLEPHGARWVPALDVPLRIDFAGSKFYSQKDDTLNSPMPIRGVSRYTAWSRPEQRAFEEMEEAERTQSLKTPRNLPPRVLQLAAEWKGQSRSDLEIVQFGISYLQQNGFKYTLTPDEYSGPNALETFLLEGKNGFCEHYAASFATLMRLAGVPARVVVGFLGGEYSEKTRQMIIRQSDAHAWVEVWLKGQGWTRLDPTAALVPARVGNPRGYFAGGAGSGSLATMSTWSMMLFETRLFWDRLNFAWQENVVEYDKESQQGWLDSLGWLRRSGIAWQPWHLLSLSAALLIATALGIYRWLRRAPPHVDPWSQAWLKLCDKLRRAGWPSRKPSEGPLAYAQRVQSDQLDIHPLAQMYVEGRYGTAKSNLHAFSAAIKKLRLKPAR